MIKKINVLVPNRPFYGHMSHQIPFYLHLRKIYPGAEITVWSKFENSKMMLNLGIIDHLEIYGKNALFPLISKIRKNKAEVTFNLYTASEKAHIATWLSGSKHKYGFCNSKALARIYNLSLRFDKTKQYLGLNYMDLLNAMGQESCDFSILNEMADDDLSRKKNDGYTVTLLPGGGEGDHKRWGIENYCQTVDSLFEGTNTPVTARFILGPDESHYTEVIDKHTKNCSVEIYQSPTVNQIISLAQTSDIAVANDCGPSHIFQMMEVPLIMIFGWKRADFSPFHIMSEWYHSSEDSWTIVPAAKEQSIHSISVEKVQALVQAQLLLNEKRATRENA